MDNGQLNSCFSVQQQWSAYTKSHNGIMALAYMQISEFCINLKWTIPFAARDNSRTVRKKKDNKILACSFLSYKHNGWMIILNKNISYCVQFDADQLLFFSAFGIIKMVLMKQQWQTNLLCSIFVAQKQTCPCTDHSQIEYRYPWLPTRPHGPDQQVEAFWACEQPGQLL